MAFGRPEACTHMDGKRGIEHAQLDSPEDARMLLSSEVGQIEYKSLRGIHNVSGVDVDATIFSEVCFMYLGWRRTPSNASKRVCYYQRKLER